MEGARDLVKAENPEEGGEICPTGDGEGLQPCPRSWDLTPKDRGFWLLKGYKQSDVIIRRGMNKRLKVARERGDGGPG